MFDEQTKLQELAELAGADTAKRMAQLLLIELEDAVPKIIILIAQSDLGAAASLAHGLAGVTASVGCFRLAQIARSLEADLRAGTIYPDLLSQMGFAVTQAKSNLAEFILSSN